jgi:two-component system OmpR family response regulator
MLLGYPAAYRVPKFFGAGVDDYLTKPSSLEQLLSRLRAITRRNGRRDGYGRLEVGDLVLDRPAHEVLRAKLFIQLAPKELALLECLRCHPGQVLSRTVILDRVQGLGFASFTNVVDATVSGLRKALDIECEQPLIHTVRGVGYNLKASRGSRRRQPAGNVLVTALPPPAG